MTHKKQLQCFRILLTAALSIMIVLLLAACGVGSQGQESFTIGVVNEGEVLNPALEGLKEGMAELGYVEGENITYIYNGITGVDPEALDQEIESLVAQDADLIFSMGSAPALQARQAVEEYNVPAVGCPFVNPVEEGLVESIIKPGVNMTGIDTGGDFPKAVDWLLTFAPAKTIYAPYNPSDEVSAAFIPVLKDVAPALGVDLIVDEVSTPEEVIAGMKALDEDAVVFLVPIPSLEAGMSDYAATAKDYDIAVGTHHPGYVQYGFLTNYSIDLHAIGVQAARLVDQVFRGVSPADLPVERGDGILTVNLVTAKAINLDISDSLMRQADTIIR